MLFSGKSGINFFQWLIVWIFGCFIFCGITQLISFKKRIQQRQSFDTTFQTKIENVSPDRAFTNYDNSYTNANFDNMDGHDFEYFCANLLTKNGFTNVNVTKGSGDHGIDILAEKDSITYAIQCKCYSKDIGNAAVQQAHTGKSIYKKDIAVVLTNRNFTPQAKEEAELLSVKLWNREKLLSLINIANK